MANRNGIKLIYKKMINWILNNKEWLFSGCAVTFIGIVISFFIKKNNGFSQKAKSRDNSPINQIGGNYITKKTKR